MFRSGSKHLRAGPAVGCGARQIIRTVRCSTPTHNKYLGKEEVNNADIT
jgi:hypothetical protein